MSALPLPWTTSAAHGSQWAWQFQFPFDISTATFELVLRTSTDDTGTPAALITSTASSGAGYMTVNTSAQTVMAVLSPTATAALKASRVYELALWMNPGTSTATALVRAKFTCDPIAAAA